jgi:bifunctional non-homologous end joining protein LigD
MNSDDDKAADQPTLVVAGALAGDDRALARLKTTLEPLPTGESPFDAPLPDTIDGVTFVQPVLAGEVRFNEWTPENRLRQPSSRGLRPDKKPDEVVAE